MNNDFRDTNPQQNFAGYGGIDAIDIMDRYGINLSAARVLKVVDQLVYASRLKGTKDRRGIPYCYASKEWMAGKIGKSLRTVARAIRDLKAAGLIECRRTKGNAMIFITGYELNGTSEGVRTESARTPSAATAHDGAVARAEEQPASAAGGACYAHETATNGTSCAGASRTHFAMDGTSQTATNGTSNYNTLSYNRQPHNPSIVLSPRAGKGKTDDGEAIRAERRRIYDEMRERMIQHIDIGSEEYGAANTLCRYIADAVATKQAIRVNGADLPAEQYWETVGNIRDGGNLCEMLRRVADMDRQGAIRNRRAYLLSSAYNCALWDGVSGLRAAPGNGKREWKNPALDYAMREWEEPDEGYFYGTPKWIAEHPDFARELGFDVPDTDGRGRCA